MIVSYSLTGKLFSRYHLAYHSPSQILWGASIGIVFGLVFYSATELIPTRRPRSALGKLRIALLANPVSTWLRIRDGWAVWPDSGTEEQWLLWRNEWNKRLEVKEKSI